MTNKKQKSKVQYTTPITIDQRAVKASDKVFGSANTTPLREKPNIKRPNRRRKK